MPSRSALITQARLVLALLVCAFGLGWIAPVLAAQGGPVRAAALGDLCASVMAAAAVVDADGLAAPGQHSPVQHQGGHQHDQCPLCAGASLAPPPAPGACALLADLSSAPVQRLLAGRHQSAPAQQQARAPPVALVDLG
ncbi:MAG: hypothetical protein RIQ60_2497 [Pseudomonadota bacterium]